MRGMSRDTGKALSGIAHLKQSVQDILTTSVGERVMRRDYGSRLPDLIDAPVSRTLFVDIHIAVADALSRWEPRLQLIRIEVSLLDDASRGRLAFRLTGNYRPERRSVVLEDIVV